MTASTAADATIAPPPWALGGQAAVLLLSGPPRTRGLLPGVSALAFVAYARSPVGPYGELLHVPRLTHAAGAFGPTIDRIWVDSPASVASGRANWGLPKALAMVELVETDRTTTTWTAVSSAGELLARLRIRACGRPLPAPLPAVGWRLLQRSGTRSYATPIATLAAVRAGRVEELHLGPALDDVRQRRVLGAIVLPRFRMRFGRPDVR